MPPRSVAGTPTIQTVPRFGRYDHVVPTNHGGQQPSEDAFSLPALVDVGGVDECAARVHKRREQVGRLTLLGILAPGHRASGDGGDPQARSAQMSLFHGAESTVSRQSSDTALPHVDARCALSFPGLSALRGAVLITPPIMSPFCDQ